MTDLDIYIHNSYLNDSASDRELDQLAEQRKANPCPTINADLRMRCGYENGHSYSCGNWTAP